ncbi:MAG: hypothetical protein ACXWQO_17135 [Bdellovibrionota bacterium]
MPISKLFLGGLLLTISAHASAMDLKGFYKSLSGTESQVTFRDSEEHVLLGVSVFEKSERNVFCRRRAPVVPHPVYSYSCYVEVSDVNAMMLYNELAGEPLSVELSTHESKDLVQEKYSSGYLCQFTTPAVGEKFARCFAPISE